MYAAGTLRPTPTLPKAKCRHTCGSHHHFSSASIQPVRSPAWSMRRRPSCGLLDWASHYAQRRSGATHRLLRALLMHCQTRPNCHACSRPNRLEATGMTRRPKLTTRKPRSLPGRRRGARDRHPPRLRKLHMSLEQIAAATDAETPSLADLDGGVKRWLARLPSARRGWRFRRRRGALSATSSTSQTTHRPVPRMPACSMRRALTKTMAAAHQSKARATIRAPSH